MAKKKKQIHLNIIDLQKIYQKDDLIISSSTPEENAADIKKKKIFEKNELVQNIEWRTVDLKKQTNNKTDEINNKKEDNKIYHSTFDKNNNKKNDTVVLGGKNKTKANILNGEDIDFANVRSKASNDVDFANLRRKASNDVDFANLRRKASNDVDFAILRSKASNDVDFTNLRNKSKDDVDFANIRSKRSEDVDHGNMRSKKNEDVDLSSVRNKRNDDVDFSNVRNKKSDDVDFSNVRNKKSDDIDFSSVRNKRNDSVDFSNVRSKTSDNKETKENTETNEKPYYVLKLEQLRKEKESEKKTKDGSISNNTDEKREKDEVKEDIRGKEAEKEAEKGAEKEVEKEVEKEGENKVERIIAEMNEKIKDQVKQNGKDAKDVNDSKEGRQEEEVKVTVDMKEDNEMKKMEVASVEEKTKAAGMEEKVKEGEMEKKKFVPKRVIMYRQALKEQEEKTLKKLEEEKAQRELKRQLIKSQGLSTFIPSAKLLHMKNMQEQSKDENTKENKNEGKKKGGSIKNEEINENKKYTATLKRNKIEEQSNTTNAKNVKNIILELAEKTENAKIVEKADIEEIAKKRREEIYKKQLEKITKQNEENTRYNNIYKHDLNSIKLFYNQIKNKIYESYAFTQEECASVCTPLKMDECNYLESHVPFYVALSVFILSIPQKAEDDVYLKKAQNMKNLLLYLKQNSKIENHDQYILNDTINLCDKLNYPHISEETSLIEAAFDSLLFSGVIPKDSFIKWFQEDDFDSELKSKAMLQLIYWHKWVTAEEDEEMEGVEEEEEEEVEEVEEDEKAINEKNKMENASDIEKNVPKNFIFKKIKKKFI
ncbi:conserved Plasmodium protein, unknown function [Plasmodium malariae]|uniref:W2 domain-containing protein n=1 Tax=Plasmodium malariae TaxID=5858 RepID=A0A1A8WP12_PLAMA|nr:conserved Plasmodium protein, unknown function [Plasmodium malariae]